MSEMINERDQMIEDALSDLMQDDDDTDTTETAAVEETPEVEAAANDPTEEVTKEPAVTAAEKVEAVVEKPVPVPSAEVIEEFSKRFGIPEKTVTGRENRIPYSRVKKIIEKNERELKDKYSKQFDAEYKPKLSDYETKVKDYEGRLEKVGQFEQVLFNDPQAHLQTLSQIPAYKPFFDYLNKVAAEQDAKPSATVADPAKQPVTVQFVDDPADPRPGPNKTAADGSKVYDLDGHQQLMDWYERRATKRATEEASKRFDAELSKRLGPIEQERQKRDFEAKSMAIIDKQLADARTWPMFTEHEDAITAALAADRNLSLEGAYRNVVLPKLVEKANTARSTVLTEMKRQPASTAVITRTAPRQPQVVAGDRDAMILAELQKQGLI